MSRVERREHVLGVVGRLAYFGARALANLRQNLFVSVVSTCTTALALLVMALFLLLYVNLERAVDGWSGRVQVTAYFEQELQPLAVAALKSQVKVIPGTAKLTYVTKAEAAARLRARLKEQPALLEGVSDQALPASLEISLDRAHRDAGALAGYVAALKKVNGIGEVQYGEQWVQRFSSFLTLARMVGALLGGFLAVTVLFIVANTIQLTVYARREEIELLGLVGATRLFIKAPYLIEGALQGGLAAVVALSGLGLCHQIFLRNAAAVAGAGFAANGIVFLPICYQEGLFLAGVLLGLLGSLVSLRRFIRI